MTPDIREILEQLWIDCNNTPTDGTIYDPVGVLTDQALTAIDLAYKKWFMEIMPKEKELLTFSSGLREGAEHNQVIKEIRERLK